MPLEIGDRFAQRLAHTGPKISGGRRRARLLRIGPCARCFGGVRRHFRPKDSIARTIFAVARLRIGELLVEAKVITPAQLDEALRAPRGEGQKIGHLLVEQGLVTETQLTQTLSLQLSVPWVSLYHIDFSRQLLNMVPRELAERFASVPIFVRNVKKQGNSLYVAMEDPTNEAALSEISRAAGLPVKPMIACLSDIRSAIRVYYANTDDAPGGAPAHFERMERPEKPEKPEKPERTAERVGERTERDRDRVGGPPPVPPPVPSTRLSQPGVPPPAPRIGRAPLPTMVDSAELVADRLKTVTEETPAARLPISEDSPDAAPELEVTEPPKSSRPPPRAPMVSLTLLDGTTVDLPTRTSSLPPQSRRESPVPRPPGSMSDQLTARDLVSALRAVAHGADASEVLGNTEWQAMFAALLSLMLKKNLIADWEFVEELRNI